MLNLFTFRTSGYWSLGTSAPGELPATSDLYGTEVCGWKVASKEERRADTLSLQLFELNTNLLQRMLIVTKHLTLNDSTTAAAYRKKFDYAPANLPPKVTQCDVLTSDVYFAGTLLAESFGNLTETLTQGAGTYCTTAQEDNATLEAMVRAHKAKLVDYSRIIVLRTVSLGFLFFIIPSLLS